MMLNVRLLSLNTLSVASQLAPALAGFYYQLEIRTAGSRPSIFVFSLASDSENIGEVNMNERNGNPGEQGW